jgi:hypothetical protein
MLVRMILKQRKQSTMVDSTNNTQKKGLFSSISSGEKDDVEDFNDILNK